MSPAAKSAEFEGTLRALAEHWSRGEMERALSLFAPDVVYHEPPDRQLCRGIEELRAHFLGGEGRPPIRMCWHHMAYSPETGVGFGEYSFEMFGLSHGVVVVKMKEGRIWRWREYRTKSALGWEAFSGPTSFAEERP